MNSKTSKMLIKEHKKILKEVEKLGKECTKIESGASINKAFFEKMVEFIREYADKFHHAKEEDILFKEICKNENNFHCNPVKQMLLEHQEGRKFVRGILKGLKENNSKDIVQNSEDYIRLIREHIFKEDNILYPMADENLSKKTLDNMYKKFNKINFKG